MKISKKQLKQIINEEHQKMIKESESDYEKHVLEKNMVDLDKLTMDLANAWPRSGTIDIKELMEVVAMTLINYASWDPKNVAKGMDTTAMLIYEEKIP